MMSKWRKWYALPKNKEKEAERKRKYYKENKDIILKRTKKWRKENPEKFYKLMKKYRQTDKIKVNARNLAKIHFPLKDKICKCGEKAIERHHEDYDKPLEVELVCKKCHLKLDKLKKERESGF